ncbi:hypothetical protein SJAV_11060 [Sulfurisphaera javensis]|uniref:Uncharacterized protein n=2 Tax=Sulfurisphaera javensis TaxID=2049879 RepID=A0AAT9GQT7_9CREN
MYKRAFFIYITSFLLALLSTLFILRQTLLSSGLIFVRDSYPSLLGYISPLVSSGEINILFLMDNPDFPISIFQLFPQIYDKLNYAYPIFLGYLSAFFATRYILNSKYKDIIAFLTAFLYVVSPTFMYFTYWSNYVTFVALYPILLVGLSYVSKLSTLKGAILLSFLLTLTTTDPRGFVFSFLTLFLYVIYQLVRRNFRYIKLAFFSLPLYVVENIRTFYALFVQQHVYTSIGNSISVVQLWLNYNTFSFADNLRGIGLFVPLVNFYAGNYFFSYLFSFFLPVFVILGVVFYAERVIKTDVIFYFSLYIFLVIFLSSSITIFNHTFTLNFIYYLNDWLKQTPFFPYMWIILPTYLSEMIPAPLFLTFAFIGDQIILTRREIPRLIGIMFVILVIIAQLVFSYPSYATGNYYGNYVPTPIPKNLVEVAEYLHGAKVAVYGGPIYYNGKWYSAEGFAGIPNAVFLPFYNTTSLGEILQYYGVEYVVANKNISYFLAQKDLKLVANFSGIYIFKNLDYRANFTSQGVYILVGPVTDLNEDVAVVPPYIYVPPQYLAGVICGGEIYLKADVFHNYSVKIPAQRLPYPTNFSCTIYVNSGAQAILSSFPGISLIQVGSPASEYISTSPGCYAVVLTYVAYPKGGVIEISNGTASLTVNTQNVSMEVITTYLGKIYTTGKLKLIHPDSRITYLVSLELIPYSLFIKNVILHPKNVTVTVYPVEGDVIPSIGYNIIIGKVYPPPNYDLTPVLIINVIAVVLLLLEYKYSIISRKVKRRML